MGGWKALRHVDQLHTVRARGGAVACTPPSVECYPAAAAAAAAAEDDDEDDSNADCSVHVLY